MYENKITYKNIYSKKVIIIILFIWNNALTKFVDEPAVNLRFKISSKNYTKVIIWHVYNNMHIYCMHVKN